MTIPTRNREWSFCLSDHSLPTARVTYAFSLTTLSPSVSACETSNGAIPILIPSANNAPFANTEIDIRALALFRQDILLYPSSYELALAYSSWEIRCRKPILEKGSLVTNIFNGFLRQGYSWDIQHCRRSRTPMFRFDRMDHICRSATASLWVRGDIPQCQKT
jgi:hypothetical protein